MNDNTKKEDKELIDSRSELEFLQEVSQNLKNASTSVRPATLDQVIERIDTRILKVGSGHVKSEKDKK